MYGDSPEDVFYYLTVYNEPYPQPAAARHPAAARGRAARHLPAGAAPRASRRRRRCWPAASRCAPALEAQELLRADWGVGVDVWSVTSWNELRRDALACDEHALLHPDEPARTPYVTRALLGATGPVVAVSDWMRAVPGPDQPLGARRLHLARHRRLRPLRHPGGAAPALPHRRRVDRRRGARGAGPPRATWPATCPAKAVERYRLRDDQVTPDRAGARHGLRLLPCGRAAAEAGPPAPGRVNSNVCRLFSRSRRTLTRGSSRARGGSDTPCSEEATSTGSGWTTRSRPRREA